MPNLAKLVARLKPLFKLKTLPGWILALPTVGRWLYKSVDFFSNMDWVYTVFRSGWVTTAWEAVISPTGSFVTMVLGIGWIAVVVAKDKPKQLGQGKESPPSGSIDLAVHDSLHGCPDERLHRWAKDDRASAWRMVKFIGASCELHVAEDGPPPFIIFTFAVFSMSLCEVSIREEIAGSIEFKVPEHKAWRLRRSVEMEYNGAKQVLFRGNYHFKVRQNLTREDADYIRGNTETGFFKMDELVIRISGEGLDNPRLDTRFSVKAIEGYQPTLTDFLFPTVQG